MDPRAAAALLDDLADRGWPAEHRERHAAWTLRAAGGVTKRANSALPVGPVDDPDAALDAVEAFARDQGIDACVQVSPASEPADLSSRLAARGYMAEARTLVQVADAGAVAERLADAAPADPALQVAVADAPDDAWLDAWWSVDGRGGSAELAVARGILERGPSVYAAVRDGDRVLATARLALVGGWGGLFAVATRPEARRRGLSRAAMGAAVRAGAERGITDLWLQVVAENHGARALYEGLGFAPASRYEYWARTRQPSDATRSARNSA
ncbi:GNAT family N-acetyltransferase [Clavibacter michiganensis subsp. insidiosus]|uniref:GNAT family acetyltransferase n=4 Tax=Clavibacter michiganensis TaxID=28447 RepID=A0A0D5CM18_9MICO|nr:GNAT family acetyltransferase [Clavibacter michiganensis subsp. insidiosus]OQJ61393.1 N-acetyltransferase [Clavibacter michiganensis subsp. insidiosus]RMC86259.1 GNAT family N-acetyltransferase [Clavibacter michiganensis subsp. insidiosus]